MDVLERSPVMSSMIAVSIMMNALRRKMMWAADFDEDVVAELEENCLEQLVIQFQRNLSTAKITKISENGHPLFGLTRANFWSRNDQLQPCSTAATRNEDDELSVFIVAAIQIINHQKIFREAHSMDDVIKIFNDNMLKINVKICISMAIKLRKKYFYKEKFLYQPTLGTFSVCILSTYICWEDICVQLQ